MDELLRCKLMGDVYKTLAISLLEECMKRVLTIFPFYTIRVKVIESSVDISQYKAESKCEYFSFEEKLLADCLFACMFKKKFEAVCDNEEFQLQTDELAELIWMSKQHLIVALRHKKQISKYL